MRLGMSLRKGWKWEGFSFFFIFFGGLLHPRNSTWNPKMKAWKMVFLFKLVIFRFHVSFRECIGKNTYVMGKHLLWQTSQKRRSYRGELVPSRCVRYALEGPITTITLLHYRFTSLLQPLLLGDGIETLEIFNLPLPFFCHKFYCEHMDG